MLSISGATETVGAQLFDRRRNRAVACLLESLFSYHDGSFSASVGSAGRQAAHRLFASEEIGPNDLLSGHIAATAERARLAIKPGGRLLIVQDTTEFDYSHHLSTSGLGSIGKPPRCKIGVHAHGALAVTDTGVPLGVVDLAFWSRPVREQAMSKAERRKINRRKAPEDRESAKWPKCVRRVQQQMPDTISTLFIQDREADMFELFAVPRRPGEDLLVRAAYPRKVEVLCAEPAEEQPYIKLFAAARSAPLLGQTQVYVPAAPKRKERIATLDVRARPVLLRAEVRRAADRDRTPVLVWLISAEETSPPTGADALSWTLICTLPAQTLEAACELIGFYTARWLIERLHFVLKSGLNAEKLRFDDAHSLENALALYYIVAWRLLHLTYLARKEPEQPAATCFDEAELQVLTLVAGREVDNVAAAVLVTAKLAGYTPTPKGPPPGVILLWRGMRRLTAMAEGFLLARSQAKNVNH